MTGNLNSQFIDIIEKATRIQQNASEVFVRENRVDGTWKTYSLIQLPVELALLHAFKMIFGKDFYEQKKDFVMF
jgi:hypothetical protein